MKSVTKFNETMQVFKIRKDELKEIRKKMLLRSIPFLFIACAAGIAIVSVNFKQEENVLKVLPIIIPVIAATLGFGIFYGVNRQMALIESCTLTITNGLVTREQLSTPTISIYFDDIKEITKHKDGGFTIKGKNAVDLIVIPAQIDNFLQLETALREIKPILVQDKVPFLAKYQSLTGLVTVGLLLCVFTLSNKIIVALTGSALVAIMVWSFIKIRGSRNFDSKTKRSVWLVLLVIAQVIAVMIFKLTGLFDMQNH